MSNASDELFKSELGVHQSDAPPPKPVPNAQKGALAPVDGKYDEDFDKDVEKPVVTGLGEYPKEEADPEEQKKRRKRIAAVGLLLLLVALLLVLGLLLGPDDEPKAKVSNKVTGAPNAAIAPSEPTPFPTPLASTTTAPTGSSPTTSSAPTTPTVEPTFSSVPGPKSRLPCNEIRAHPNVTAGNQGGNNFKLYTLTNSGITLCSDTFAGPDEEREDRNFWNAQISRRDCFLHTFDEGTAVCEVPGARRCTADELQTGAGQGSGCGGDNELLFSNTPCTTEDDEEGILLVNFALKFNGTFFRCEPNPNSVKTITKCCGDVEV